MITNQDIENIALLAKLFVPEEEIPALRDAMQETIDFADTINKADIEGEEFDSISGLSNQFREDVVVESLSAQEILSNAPEAAQDHFLVRKRV